MGRQLSSEFLCQKYQTDEAGNEQDNHQISAVRSQNCSSPKHKYAYEKERYPPKHCSELCHSQPPVENALLTLIPIRVPNPVDEHANPKYRKAAE